MLDTQPATEEQERLTAAARSDLAVYVHASDSGQVTFHDVAGAWFHMSDPQLPARLREEFRDQFPALVDRFAAPRGGIITGYFCRHIRVAAVLTDIEHAAQAAEGLPRALLDGDDPHGDSAPPRMTRLGRVFQAPPASSSAIHLEPTFGDPVDWPAKSLLFECLHLHYKALEFLTPQPRKICMRMIFGVIVALLGTLDARHAPGAARRPFPSEPAELATLQRELNRARTYYEGSTQRQAQIEYFVGMLASAAVIGAVFTVLALTINVLDRPLLVSLFAGAVGAVISVMTRMTSGNLVLKPESGKWLIRFLGMFRPVIGAVFGAAVYVLLAGGLIALSSPAGGDRALYFAGLGFVAGFSERFAQDAIAGAAGAAGIGGGAREVPDVPPAPAPSLPPAVERPAAHGPESGNGTGDPPAGS